MQYPIELRIKALALASEAKHIRRWERRLLKARRRNPQCQEQAFSLRRHRTEDVRREARDTLLAYGFLRGKPYAVLEQKRYSDPRWDNIRRMAGKFSPMGSNSLDVSFAAWKEAAGKPLKR